MPGRQPIRAVGTDSQDGAQGKPDIVDRRDPGLGIVGGELDPAAAVFHYAQEIFEGLKAYRTADGGATLFRPIENARRFQKSAERLAMPSLPEELFLESCDKLVSIDRAWIPEGDGSLYLRPFMFAN